jgi:HSP20 family protein
LRAKAPEHPQHPIDEQRMCPAAALVAAALQQRSREPALVRKPPNLAESRRTHGTGRSAPRGFSGTDRGGTMQLTRWSPFVELDEIQQRLNRLFLDRTATTGETSFADFMPPVDIEETDADLLVKADLPDVKKEAIKVHVQDGVLTIEGERRLEKDQKGRRFHKLEREYGRFVRRFALPTEVDADKVRAEFKDGVLLVVLPKAPAAKPKMVDVTVG